MAARTLSDVDTDLADARAALKKAEVAVAYSQGDRQVTRANLDRLQRRVNSLEREWAERTAAANGAANPMIITPKWV